MPSTSSTLVNALDRYSNPFLGMYESSCGDKGSYVAVRPRFLNFVTSRATESIKEGRFKDAISYASIAMGLAPVAAAANAFEMFLDNKANCHENSIAGEAFSMAGAFVKEPGKLSLHFYDNKEFVAISDPTRLYIGWQKSVTTYMEHVADLEEIVRAAKGDVSPDVKRMIWAAANRAEIFAGIVNRTVRLLKTSFAGSVAWNMVRQQHGRINNFRNVVYQLREASLPVSKVENSLEAAKSHFVESLEELHDPFDWIAQVVSWYQPKNGAAKKFKIVFPENSAKLRIDKADALWEIIDWVVIVADRSGSEQKPLTIEFGLNDEKNLVIRIPLVETHVWSYIDAVLRRVRGSRLTVLRDDAFFTEVRVPLKDASPAPERGGGGSVTGTFRPDEISGPLPSRGASPAALSSHSRRARGFRPVINPYFSPIRVWGAARAVFRAPAVFAK